MPTSPHPHPSSVTSPDWPCRHDPDAAPPPRLHAFLYRLLRDGAPAPGDVEQIALDVADSSKEITFTNPHLDEYARALVTFLLTEPRQRDREPDSPTEVRP